MGIVILLSALLITLSIYFGLSEIANAIKDKPSTITIKIEKEKNKDYQEPLFVKYPPSSHKEQMRDNPEYAKLYNEKKEEMGVRAIKNIEEGKNTYGKE